MTRLLIGMLLILLVFTKHGTGHKEGDLPCGPQNMMLSKVNQSLQVTWDHHPLCLSVKDLIYELVVLVDSKQVHYAEVAVTADRIGSSDLSWSWMSSRPLECSSHSVRIRSRDQNHTSPWTEKTIPGPETSKEIEIFPQDYVFEVGSRATFCCIIPQGETFSTSAMFIGNYNNTPFNTSKINNHMYELTVDLLFPTLQSQANVKCQTQTSDAGACAVVGYPPSDSNLECQTRDFQSIECLWTAGPELLGSSTRYKLLEQSCTGQPKGNCSQKVNVESGERNWTLTAQNALGTTELTFEADLTKRVYMYAPEGVTNSVVNSRNVSLKWTWTIPRYDHLNLTCQLNLTAEMTHNILYEKNGIGLKLVVLNGLIPNSSYTAMVRCKTVSDFQKWGDWSQSTAFYTKGEIPDALDVWMHKEKQQTVIKWKMLEHHQSHGRIIDYEVSWIDSAQKGQENKHLVIHPNHSIALNLNAFQEYIVQVTARNLYGSSSPSRITVSSQTQEESKVNMSKISGISGGFSLSWSASPDASCGYIVDWCPASGECSVAWLKVPPTNTSASIDSKNFKDGVRYILSVYSCTGEAPVLLQRREGYVKEKTIPDGLFKNLRWQPHGSNVEISWDRIALTQQNAFIGGYVLYCTHDTGVLKVTTDDPEATTLAARNLNITSYQFTVKAVTTVGECGTTTIHATLNLPNTLIGAIVISLVTAFTLLLLITIVCYRHWACIKNNVYPPIPEPVLTGKWLISQGEHTAVPYCPTEELVMAVPELHCKLPASRDGYICQRDKPFGSTQTPTEPTYCNQPLKKGSPCQFILPPASISSQLGLTASKCNTFPNPLYNLVMLRNDIQTNLEAKYQDCTFEEDDSGGYQPQDFTESLDFSQTDTDSIMTCVSTYIALSQSP